MQKKGVELAKEIFGEILKEIGHVDKVVACGDNGEIEIPIKDVLEPYAWLPIFMHKCDEISTVVTGGKIWDVDYLIDESCAEGLRVVDRDDASPSARMSGIDPDKEDISMSLLYLITKNAFIRSVKIDDKSGMIRIKPLKTAYKKESRHGELLPVPNEYEANALYLKEYLNQIGESMRRQKQVREPGQEVGR